MDIEYNKCELEELVCGHIKNNYVCKEKKILIYNLLYDEIVKNNIPEGHYHLYDNGSTFDFNIRLDLINIDTLIDILYITDFK